MIDPNYMFFLVCLELGVHPRKQTSNGENDDRSWDVALLYPSLRQKPQKKKRELADGTPKLDKLPKNGGFRTWDSLSNPKPTWYLC